MADRRGFTLLEVLIATALLGIAIVSLLGLHARNIRLSAETLDLTRAGLLASHLITMTRVDEYPELGIEHGRFSSDKDLFGTSDLRYGGAGSEDFVWTREVMPTAIETLRRVRVSVSRSGDPQVLATMAVVMRQQSY